VLIIFLATALAEEPAPIVVYQERTEIDFESLDITGELVKPEGNLITERTEAVFNPLIRLRTDWNEEMSASVNEIK